MSKTLIITLLGLILLVGCTAATRTPTQPQLTPTLEPTLEPTLTPIVRADRVNPICSASHLNRLRTATIDRQLTLMQQAGIAWTRFDFEWDQMEYAEGVWSFTRFDTIYNDAQARGIQLIAMLPQWGAPVWIGIDYQSPMGADNYAAYVSQVVRHFKGKILIYELGNEPDLALFWPPSPDAASYSAYLKAGYEAVKSNDPNASVLTAGLTDNAVAFLTGMYSNGAKGYFDYLAFHPYSWPNSPDGNSGFATMNQLNAIMSANGDLKPIMVTEVGWPSTTQSGGVLESTQATYIAHVFQKVMFEDYKFVPIVCIYDFIDDGTDKINPEDNFGLVRYDYSTKPSYSTIQLERQTYNNYFNATNP